MNENNSNSYTNSEQTKATTYSDIVFESDSLCEPPKSIYPYNQNMNQLKSTIIHKKIGDESNEFCIMDYFRGNHNSNGKTHRQTDYPWTKSQFDKDSIIIMNERGSTFPIDIKQECRDTDDMRSQIIGSQTQQLDIIEHYDPFKIPSNLERAQRHGKLNRAGKPKLRHAEPIPSEIIYDGLLRNTITSESEFEKKQNVCKCCGAFSKEPLRFWKDMCGRKLAIFGPSIPLFFQFIRMSICLLQIFIPKFLIGEYFIQITNSKSDQPKKENWGLYQWLTDTNARTTEGNYAYYEDFQAIYEYIAIYQLICWFYIRQDKLLKEVHDVGMPVQSNFTMMISRLSIYDKTTQNLKSDKELEQEVIDFLTKFGINEDVYDINIATYKCRLTELIENIINHQRMLKYIQKYKQAQYVTTDHEIIDNKKISILQTLRNFENTKKEYVSNIEENRRSARLGIAFVTFKTIAKFESAQHKLKKNNVSSIYQNIIKIMSFGLQKTTYDTKQYVKKAPSADDVNWSSIGSDSLARLKLKIISLFKAGLMIVWNFLLQFGMSYIGYFLSNLEGGYFNGWFFSYLFSSWFVAFQVIFINTYILGPKISSLTLMERSLTRSSYISSAIQKWFILCFINSAITPIILFKFFPEIITSGEAGLAKYIFCIFLGGIKFTGLWMLVDHFYIKPKWWPRKKIIQNKFTKFLELLLCRKLNQYKTYSYEYNQQELNTIFEDMTWEYYQICAYVAYLNPLFVYCFFCNICPIGLQLVLINFIIMYFVNRWLLVNRCKEPKLFNKFIAYDLMSKYKWCLVLRVLADFMYNERTFINKYAYYGLFLVFLAWAWIVNDRKFIVNLYQKFFGLNKRKNKKFRVGVQVRQSTKTDQNSVSLGETNTMLNQELQTANDLTRQENERLTVEKSLTEKTDSLTVKTDLTKKEILYEDIEKDCKVKYGLLNPNTRDEFLRVWFDDYTDRYQGSKIGDDGQNFINTASQIAGVMCVDNILF